ncbi:MAG: DUF6858 family protein [Pseudomonadota bacterium]
MKQMLLQEKYPVFVLEIGKQETRCASVDDIVARLKAKITADARVAWIAEFDHYAHTQKVGGTIAPEIKAAKNLVFCFGLQLPNPQVLAVRPRSIGIADCGDKFVIDFMEAPMQPANDAMEAWARSIKDVV